MKSSADLSLKYTRIRRIFYYNVLVIFENNSDGVVSLESDENAKRKS